MGFGQGRCAGHGDSIVGMRSILIMEEFGKFRNPGLGGLPKFLGVTAPEASDAVAGRGRR